MEAILSEKIEGKKFELFIDTKIFNKYVILKSAHIFLEKGYFFFKFDKNKNIILQFTLKDGVNEKPEDIIGSYTDELLNNLLREKVFEENKEVRTEIITSAIQNSLREAELPSDWKGYDNVDDAYFGDQENPEIDFDKDIDDILKEIENDPELKIDEGEIEKILKEIESEEKNDKEDKKEEKNDNNKDKKSNKEDKIDGGNDKEEENIDDILNGGKDSLNLKMEEEEVEKILKEIEEEGEINEEIKVDVDGVEEAKKKFNK